MRSFVSKNFIVVVLLLCSLMTQSAYANELAIWDKLQGSNPKGYVLLLRHTLAPGVGDPENFKLNDCHFVNIGAVAGVGVGSGEGVLVRADSKGKISVVGLTPKLGR